jgi:pimeloyl-ACP methyl ester carboxylesterase
LPTLPARGVELVWFEHAESERGEGNPVVLVHETATGAVAWEPLAREIARGARAIAYDRRGWGDSTAPDGYRRTTIEEQSEDTAVLIEAVAGGPATVAGAGIGAVIALDLLLRRPELVARAVLIEPPLLALLPDATELLAQDAAAIEAAVADGGLDTAAGVYLSGGLAALGAGAGRLPATLTAGGRERPRMVFAEIGAPIAWSVPLLRFAAAERPSTIVTSPSTPHLLREAGRALAARLAGADEATVDVERTPPHVGAPDRVAAIALAPSH